MIDIGDFEFPEIPEFGESGQRIKIDPSISSPISKCIQEAPINSTIIIPEGNYYDNIEINRRIKLIGEGKVVICTQNGKDTITVDSPDVFLQSIQITSGNGQAASPLNLKSGSVIIQQCALSSTAIPTILTHKHGTIYAINSSITSMGGSCFRVSEDIKLLLNRCAISSTTNCGVVAGGKSLVKVTDSLITNCGDAGFISTQNNKFYLNNVQFTNNTSSGVEVSSTETNYINRCVFVGNLTCTAINCSGEGNMIISRSQFSNIANGISVQNKFKIKIDNSVFDKAPDGSFMIANNGSIDATAISLKGKCIAGALATDTGEIKMLRSFISNLEGVGISVAKSSKLELEETTIKNITISGIEVSGSSICNIKSTKVEDIGAIGILLMESKLTANELTINSCGAVCSHIIDAKGEIQFTKSSFINSRQSGICVKNSTPSFSDCNFQLNAIAGVEIKGSESKPVFNQCGFIKNKIFGVNIIDGSSPSFSASHFSFNEGIGASSQSSMPTFNRCSFEGNQQLGMNISNGTRTRIEASAFKKNGSFGAQIQNEGTAAVFSGCEFSEQMKSGAVILTDKCVVHFVKSYFHDNESVHVEAINGAQFEINGCELFRSRVGIGVIAQDGSIGAVRNCSIHDERQAGVIVGKGGGAEINGCDISKCENSGIYLIDGCSCNVHNNKIHENGTCGVQIAGGNILVVDNAIEDHAGYGIHIAAGANPQISGNIFNRNQQENVNHG